MSDPKQQPQGQFPQNETQERGLFHHEEAKKHENHHYLRMYGGQVVNAFMWGFGATLGADAANAAVGDVKEWWRH